MKFLAGLVAFLAIAGLLLLVNDHFQILTSTRIDSWLPTDTPTWFKDMITWIRGGLSNV